MSILAPNPLLRDASAIPYGYATMHGTLFACGALLVGFICFVHCLLLALGSATEDFGKLVQTTFPCDSCFSVNSTVTLDLICMLFSINFDL